MRTLSTVCGAFVAGVMFAVSCGGPDDAEADATDQEKFNALLASEIAALTDRVVALEAADADAATRFDAVELEVTHLQTGLATLRTDVENAPERYFESKFVMLGQENLGTVAQIFCETGWEVVGGGCDCGAEGILRQQAFSPNGWLCQCPTATPQVSAICGRIEG